MQYKNICEENDETMIFVMLSENSMKKTKIHRKHSRAKVRIVLDTASLCLFCKSQESIYIYH